MPSENFGRVWRRSRWHSAVEQEIRDLIRRDGRITFARFMEACLYSPRGGFYSARGDRISAHFGTSATSHPAFRRADCTAAGADVADPGRARGFPRDRGGLRGRRAGPKHRGQRAGARRPGSPRRSATWQQTTSLDGLNHLAPRSAGRERVNPRTDWIRLRESSESEDPASARSETLSAASCATS